MVDVQVLRRKLHLLEGYLATLRRISQVTLEEYLEDPRVHGSIERFLHLTAECAIDIASHLVSDQALGAPETYRDVFRILENAGQMPAGLASQMQAWAGFRNVLVHLYEGLDRERCWRAAREQLGELDDFARWAAGYL